MRHTQRNITTNPSKKGTYGTFGLTIGEKLGVTGAVGEYRYISTPYDEQRRRNAQENRQRRSAQGDTNGRRSASPLRPFKPSSPPKFGKAGYPGLTLAPVPGIVGEYVYMELGVEKASKKVRARGRRARRRRRTRRTGADSPMRSTIAADRRTPSPPRSGRATRRRAAAMPR